LPDAGPGSRGRLPILRAVGRASGNLVAGRSMRKQAWMALALSMAAAPGGCRLGPLTSDVLFPGGDAGDEAPPGMMCGAGVDASVSADAGPDGDGALLCETRYFGLVGCGCTKELNVRDNARCTAGQDPPCWTTCGPLASGTQNCTCIADPDGGVDSGAGIWRCPSCGYDPSKSYACFKRPAAPNPCPKDGTMPIRHGASCSAPACVTCGSEYDDTYRDSGGVIKKGYCVCSDDRKWSCASAFEWPPACLTDR